MKDAKVLHLALDEKFIDMAMAAFDRLGLAANHLCLYAKGQAQRVKTRPTMQFGKIRAVAGIRSSFLGQYDILIVHSLSPVFFRTLLNTPASVTVVWLGWGYDYYDLIFESEAQTLLPNTLAAERAHKQQEPLLHRFKQWISLAVMPSKNKVIDRVHYLSPVLPGEYSKLIKNHESHYFPKFARWNYGTLEDNFLIGLSDGWAKGSAILLGNSAEYTNNHREALDFLSALETTQTVIVPLSYGPSENRDSLVVEGHNALGERFIPLLEFMPYEKYNSYLLRCGYAIMNHVRQQAVGNIVVMLHLGARVFLREECITLEFLRSEGMIVNTIQELQAQPRLLQTPLSPNDRLSNRLIIQRLWSRKTSEQNTRQLIAAALNIPG